VVAPDGERIGIIKWPAQAVNFAFGGLDPRTMFCCAHTSCTKIPLSAGRAQGRRVKNFRKFVQPSVMMVIE
jgi:sugar lactone lactonase YvrE